MYSPSKWVIRSFQDAQDPVSHFLNFGLEGNLIPECRKFQILIIPLSFFMNCSIYTPTLLSIMNSTYPRVSLAWTSPFPLSWLWIFPWTPPHSSPVYYYNSHSKHKFFYYIFNILCIFIYVQRSNCNYRTNKTKSQLRISHAQFPSVSLSFPKNELWAPR